MATVTFEKWNPYGVYLNLKAESTTITRSSATQFKVTMKVSWTSSGTWWHMKAKSGGSTCVLYNGNGASTGTSGTLTGTYSIGKTESGNKTISIEFQNIDPDKSSNYKTKTLSMTVPVPAWPSYTITYNANGSGVTNLPASQKKWHGENLTISSTVPERSNYTFQGWALTATGSVYYRAGSTCGQNKNLTLYAVWKGNSYTITYNANGGSNAPTAQTKTYGSTLKITTTKPTRTNYNFLGWALSKAAADAGTQNDSYDPGDTLRGTAITSNITLYAVWELAYTKPRFDLFSIFRTSVDEGVTGSTGYVDDTSPYVAMTFYVTSDKPLYSCRLEWTSASDDGWMEFSLPNPSTDTHLVASLVEDEYGEPHQFSSELTYTFTVTVSDRTGSNSVVRTLPGSKFPIDIKARGTGIAFGKPAEEAGLADFDFQVRLGQGLMYPVLPVETDLDTLRTPNMYIGKNVSSSNYYYRKPLNEYVRKAIYNVVDKTYTPDDNSQEYSAPDNDLYEFDDGLHQTTGGWKIYLSYQIADDPDADGPEPVCKCSESIFLQELLGSGTFTLEVLSSGDAIGPRQQVLQRITSCDKSKPLILERQFYTESWGDWNVVCGAKDIVLTPADNFTISRYSIAREGNVVTLYVGIKSNNALTAGTNVQLGSIPASEAPEYSVATLGISGTSGTAACWIQNTGKLMCRPFANHAANGLIECNLTWNVAAKWHEV